MPATSSTRAVPACSGQAAGWTSFSPLTTPSPHLLRYLQSPHGNPQPSAQGQALATGPLAQTFCVPKEREWDRLRPAHFFQDPSCGGAGSWASRMGNREEAVRLTLRGMQDGSRRRLWPVHIHPRGPPWLAVAAGGPGRCWGGR